MIDHHYKDAGRWMQPTAPVGLRPLD